MAHTLDPAAFDPEVRVQDDLFRYVNGPWLAATPIADDKAAAGAFDDLRDAAELAVREILDDLAAGREPAPQGSEEAKIRDLYADFMDVDAVEARGAEPLAPLLAQVDAIETPEDLGVHLGWAARHGVHGLMGMDTDSDPGNPTRYVLFVGQGGLGLPDEVYYRDDEYAEIREAYRGHVATMLGLAGVPDAEGQAGAVLALETDIAACHWDRVSTRDMVKMYNLQDWDQFTAASPQLQWRAFVDGAGLAERLPGQVVNAQPSFFTDVAALVTPERLDAWRSWARWQAIRSVAGLLSSPFVDARFDFYERTLNGTPQLKERWKRGVALVESVLGEAIGRIYVARHFPPAAKERMDDLVAHLIEAYHESISSLDWMSAETREQALEKLAKFTPKIGFPAKWRDYSALEIVPGDLVGNAMRADEFEFERQLHRLDGPIDKDEWLMFPQTVNAYYHPLRNEIVFPAAILQPPFFSPDADDAVNYGGIGAVIGHEIGHGFDDQGSTCDGDGALRNWWTDADRAAFEQRTKSLIGQYNALVPAQLAADAEAPHVNGELTIGENIGDLGGLGIALRAWRLATAGGEVAPIDGLTGVQRLFLNWAVVWQSKIRDEALRRRLAVDPHSPNEFRCNQIARNIDAFAEAFGVRAGDGMWLDPEERVYIW